MLHYQLSGAYFYRDTLPNQELRLAIAKNAYRQSLFIEAFDRPTDGSAEYFIDTFKYQLFVS